MSDKRISLPWTWTLFFRGLYFFFSEWLEMKSVNSLTRTLQQCIRKVSNFLFKRSVCLITNTKRRLKNDRNPTLGVHFRGGGRVFVLQNCLSTEDWLIRELAILLAILCFSLFFIHCECWLFPGPPGPGSSGRGGTGASQKTGRRNWRQFEANCWATHWSEALFCFVQFYDPIDDCKVNCHLPFVLVD